MFVMRFERAAVLLIGICTLGGAATLRGQNFSAPPEALQLSGAVAGTHDPSIAQDNGKFYLFATGTAYAEPVPGEGRPKPIGQLPIRCSDNLLVWRHCGAVFPAIPAWIRTMSPATRELWAPDISYFDGHFHLYYAFSVFGKNTSGIALATNVTLDPSSPSYKWVDHGLVLQSRAEDNFNAIDPNLVLDAKGQAWLAFGSFWSGIKMRRLDRSTGLLSTTDTQLYSLASRATTQTGPRNADLPPDDEAIEAPFVFRHGKYYYLFVSWDLCCRGLKSTYRIMVGRSMSVTGPYLDRTGKPMLEGGGTQLLSRDALWLGPGGESLLHLPGRDIIVFHAYSATDGRPSLQISTVSWKGGWPSIAMQGGAGAP